MQKIPGSEAGKCWQKKKLNLIKVYLMKYHDYTLRVKDIFPA